MARPLRLELSGGLYHVTARGDGREDIYLGDADREVWLEVLGQVCRCFNWVCHAWCQMSNHYHLLLETPEANLATGMRQLNGVYTQRFNRARAGGACIPGPLQSHPGGARPLFAGTGALRGAQPAARQDGETTRRLALEQLPCHLYVDVRIPLGSFQKTDSKAR